MEKGKEGYPYWDNMKKWRQKEIIEKKVTRWKFCEFVQNKGKGESWKNLRRICFDQLYEPCEHDKKVKFSKSPICNKEKSHQFLF